MSRAKRAVIAAAALLLLPILVGAAWLTWQTRHGPDYVLQGALPRVATEQVDNYGGKGCQPNATCRDVIIETEAGPPLRFAFSLPEAAGDEKIPTVILLGGLRTGRESMKHVPDLGRNAIVTYEYPIDTQRWKRGSLFDRASLGHDAVFAVPGQLATLIQWARAQPWSDPERISLVGVSLGALVLPAGHRLAALQGQAPKASILAYGGAGLGEILAANIKLQSDWLRTSLGWLFGRALRPIEPAAHVPHLDGAFLVINGAYDEMIPQSAAEALHRITPEPKEIVVLPYDHIDPKDQHVVLEVLRVTRGWLARQGAINP